MLSGLIYCGKCGARCHGEHGNYTCYSRSKGDKRQIKDPDCKNKKWKIEELDVLVIKYVSELDFEETESVEVPVQTKVDYGKRISEIEKQLSKLIDLYQISDISFETISEKIEKLSKEKNALIEESEKELPEQISNADRLKFQERFLALLDNGPLPEKRAVSYTHLLAVDCLLLLLLQVGNLLLQFFILRGQVGNTLFNGCLLYTSRCV